MVIKEIPKEIPRDKCLDSTISLLQEGYLFIGNRVERYHSNIFETRLLGKKAICMSGKEASKVFYNPKLFQRKGALPKRVQKTLFGVNAVQTMDGQRHIRRKSLFMSVLNQDYQDQLIKITIEKWHKAINRWKNMKQIVLFDEVNYILCQAVCEWAGVPLQLSEVKYRAKDFSLMVSNFGEVGPKYWQSKKARCRTEKWIKGIIEDTRLGKLNPGKNSVLYKVAFYKEENAEVMAPKMAAIELINILRPIIAISRFITFAALGLHEHKEYKELVLKDEISLELFTQEVRRYYPFAPFLGAVVKKNFMWNGYKFKKGTLVLLDLYGTNHDSHIWKNPEKFRPERFKGKKESLYDFIPQGGGKTSEGHRCPGERITIELIKLSLDFLIYQIAYEVPYQDLSYSLTKIPTLPQSGFIMSNIKSKQVKSKVLNKIINKSIH